MEREPNEKPQSIIESKYPLRQSLFDWAESQLPKAAIACVIIGYTGLYTATVWPSQDIWNTSFLFEFSKWMIISGAGLGVGWATVKGLRMLVK